MTISTVVTKEKRISCRLHCRAVKASVNLSGLNEIFSKLNLPSILGGNKAKSDADGFSYWAAEPREIFEFRSGQKDPFNKLKFVLDKYSLEKDIAAELPGGIFCGGWIGYFSYELGRHIEVLPHTTVDDLKMPLIRLCFYDKVLCYDHHRDCFRLIAIEIPGDPLTPMEKLDRIEKLLMDSQEISLPEPAEADIENIEFSSIRCNMDKSHYLEAAEKIRRYIYDGIVYQVNLSQRFDVDFDARPIDLYHWQNHYNPSGYAAYIDSGEIAIVSASPEMFITLNDRVISTKPIKGTRPRLADRPENEKINRENFDGLLHSEKEKAELNMIIDLERNDIARICEPGTRKVVQPRTIEAYPTVFHAVATVAGKLRDDAGFCDILRGIFPGGSITGAPKISSMEIIDETEPTERGVYTGSIGFIGIDGNVCLNIAIRTIIITCEKAFVQTGGGIVADSDAEAEWQETITKARALLAGIKSVTRKV